MLPEFGGEMKGDEELCQRIFEPAALLICGAGAYSLTFLLPPALRKL